MDSNYERYLHDQLTVLRREYEKAAEPLLKQLADLTPEQIERVKEAMKSRGVI